MYKIIVSIVLVLIMFLLIWAYGDGRRKLAEIGCYEENVFECGCKLKGGTWISNLLEGEGCTK